MAGKGDKPRPLSVDRETFNANYDRIFGHNKGKQQAQREQVMDELTQLGEQMGGYHDEQDKPFDD